MFNSGTEKDNVGLDNTFAKAALMAVVPERNVQDENIIYSAISFVLGNTKRHHMAIIYLEQYTHPHNLSMFFRFDANTDDGRSKN